MTPGITLVVGVMVIVLFLVVYALARVRVLRSGVPVLLRPLPAHGERGWRHGAMRIRHGTLFFYRVSSLRLTPDWAIVLRGHTVGARRAPRGDEWEIMSEEVSVLEVRGEKQDGFEIAGAEQPLTAFLASLESQPVRRRLRTQFKQ